MARFWQDIFLGLTRWPKKSDVRKMRLPGTAEEKQPFPELLEPMAANESRFFNCCRSSLKERELLTLSIPAPDQTINKKCFISTWHPGWMFWCSTSWILFHHSCCHAMPLSYSLHHYLSCTLISNNHTLQMSAWSLYFFECCIVSVSWLIHLLSPTKDINV